MAGLKSYISDISDRLGCVLLVEVIYLLVLLAVGLIYLTDKSKQLLSFLKDQVMAVCKVAAANLAMWVCDRYFSPSYAQTTWKRLPPFFQLSGTIMQNDQMVQVQLRPFNDRTLNRDLALLCERVNQASPHLPNGRRLSFTIHSTCCVLAAQKVSKIP